MEGHPPRGHGPVVGPTNLYRHATSQPLALTSVFSRTGDGLGLRTEKTEFLQGGTSVVQEGHFNRGRCGGGLRPFGGRVRGSGQVSKWPSGSCGESEPARAVAGQPACSWRPGQERPVAWEERPVARQGALER